jgi:hypothetical protein
VTAPATLWSITNPIPVQARRSLEVSLASDAPLTFVYRPLGQLPFYPPNVKGWDGGKSWINTAIRELAILTMSTPNYQVC